MNLVKNTLKRLINASGFELRRLKPKTSAAFQLLAGLKAFDVDLVFDVGANAGQFAAELRDVGYQGEIVSFEPLSEAFEKLSERAARDSRWHVHQRGAIGDQDGEIEINVSANSVSSSVLPMLDAHSSAATNSAYVGVEKTPISRLDTVAPDYLSLRHNYFIKIDTQGFEWQALDGARELLGGAQGVLCELSLVPLYEGQRLWLQMIERVEQEGFTLWAIQKGFTDPRNGRSLQVNAIFFREASRD